MSSVNNVEKIEERINSIPVDIFAITSFICSSVYIFLFSILIKQESFPLTSFPYRIIGISILEGIDTVARTHLYLYSLILTGILALILLLVLEKFLDWIIPPIYYKKERFFLALLSILGSSNLIFGILTKNAVFLFNVYLIIFILLCVITFIIIKKYAEIKQHHSLPLLEEKSFIITILLIPLPFVFAIQVFEGVGFVFSFFTFIEYYVLFIILLVALTGLFPNKLFQTLDEKFRLLLTTSIIPLFFYPLSIPLTNELQYTLSQWFVIDPRILSLGVFAILILTSYMLYRIQVHKNHSFIELQFSLNNLSLPAILAAISLYANYLGRAPFKSVQFGGNLFEFGMTHTVLQQLFDFGKIPFINIVNPHGFSDIFYAIFYSILNGYQPFDSFLWKWITPVIITLTGYFFLKEFVEGELAILLMIFLPIFGIFHPTNFVIILAGIFFIRFWRNPQLISYFFLLLTLIFCFIWRAESGVSSIFAICFISIFLYAKLLKKTPSQLWREYSKYIYTTIGIVGVGIFIFLILCLITHESPIIAVQSVINLYIINDPVGTFPGLYPTYDARVALQYAIFPLFGLSVILFFIWIAITRKDNVTAQLILIAFLAIATLFLSQRGIQRHSLIEGFSAYYFPLIACSIPLLWYRSKKLLSIIIVIVIIGSGSFIAQYPLTPVDKDFSTPFFKFIIWENHESRVQVQAIDLAPVGHLTDYLNATLRPEETFFDMSNYLMPYTLLRKDYVPNTVSNLLQAGEWNQNETIKRLIHNRDRIAIVVTGGWQTDKVPNEMRTYRISEYIYKNYRPIGQIDNYEIWHRNDYNNNYFNISYNQSYLTPLSGKDLLTHNIQLEIQDGVIILHSGSNDPYVENFIPNGTTFQQSELEYSGLHLVYKSDTSGPLQVFYSTNTAPFSPAQSVVRSINKGNSSQDYYVVFPANINTITNIRIDPPNNSNVTLIQAYLYPHSSLLILDTRINRDYDLKKFPYIWGTFDKADPASHQPVQNVLFEGELQVDMDNPVQFTNISPDLDKTSGNYILIKLKSPRAGEINMEYGYSNESSEIPATMKFETISSEKEQNYILRVSSQWDWYAASVSYLRLTPTEPITLYNCEILKGD